MNLKLKRSQHSTMLTGKVIFELDARLEFDSEERALVDKYKLGKQTIYDSENRRKHADSARLHMAVDEATDSFRNTGRIWLSSALAALSLRVSIESLTGGQHIECKSLDELLAAEEAIREACTNVRVYLNVASQFDGREEVIAF